MKDFEAKAPRVHASIVCAGLTLNLLFAILTLWGGLPIYEVTGLGIAQIVEYWTVALMISLSLTLIASLMIRSSPSSKSFLGGAFVCCGLLACGCAFLFAEQNSISIIFSGICVGVGLGLSCILWQEQLSLLDENMFARIPFIALALSSALYLVIATTCSGFAQSIIAILDIVATLVLLLGAYKIGQKYPSARKGMERSGAQELKTIVEDSFLVKLWKPIVCAAAMSALVLLTRFPALSFVDDPNLVNISAHVVILVVVAIIIIGQYGLNKSLTFNQGQSIVAIYYATFPIIATALLALLLGGSSMAIPVAALTYAGFAILVVTLMPTSIVLARESHVSAVHVYGVLLGSVYIAGSVVTLLGNSWIFVAETEPEGIIALVSVLTMYVLAISVFLLHGPFEGWIDKGNKARERAITPDQDCTGYYVSEAPSAQRPSAQRIADTDSSSTVLHSLATSHGLTDREEDILALIVHGRDAQAIASQLYISVNTVRSHSKSIYRKLDIHSKQELLDLIDEI